MPSIQGIAEIVLFVRDQAASRKFYVDYFGLSPMEKSPPSGPIFLKAGDGVSGVPQMLVLVPKPDDYPDRSRKKELHHLAFEVNAQDFDEFVQMFTSAGIETRTGVHPVIPSRTLYVDDPDGNEVEIICVDG